MRRTRIQPAARADTSLLWFALLSPDAQRAAIYRLVDRGFSNAYIASATHLDLDEIGRVIGEREVAQ